MQQNTLETPVALFVFRRPDTTSRVFQAIADARPSRLLLVADGPRPEKQGEAEACNQVREIVSRVDWPCEVSTNFAEHNLGCQERMISGFNWVFSLVEEAILLEDDCLPHPSFFPYCQELLHKYRGDDRVGFICGSNQAAKHTRIDASYYFSRIGSCWGWATWRSKWQRYDRHLVDWPAMKKENALAEVFPDAKMAAYWTRIFDMMHENRLPTAWDYQWMFTCLKNNSLAAVSRVNAISNIGYGPGATHSTEPDPRNMLAPGRIEFPLRHPSSFVPSLSMDRRLQKLLTASIFFRAKRKLSRIARRIVSSPAPANAQ